MSVTFSFDPTPSTPLGFAAHLAPPCGGQAESGADALWGRETMVGLANGSHASGGRMGAEVSYGMGGGRFVGMLRFGLGTAETGATTGGTMARACLAGSGWPSSGVWVPRTGSRRAPAERITPASPRAGRAGAVNERNPDFVMDPEGLQETRILFLVFDSGDLFTEVATPTSGPSSSTQWAGPAALHRRRPRAGAAPYPAPAPHCRQAGPIRRADIGDGRTLRERVAECFQILFRLPVRFSPAIRHC